MVADVADVTKKRAEVIVETVFRSIAESLCRGKRVELRGFGSFRLPAPRAAPQPQSEDRRPSGRGIEHVVYFKAGKELKRYRLGLAKIAARHVPWCHPGARFGLDPDFHRHADVDIHVPAGNRRWRAATTARCGVRADSCMTGPCLLVTVSAPSPGARPASTTITSPPPPAVRHRPTATPGCRTRSRNLQVRLGRCAEHAGDGLRGDLDRGQVALGTAAHQLGAHGAERGGQPPDAGLARVAANEGRDRLAGHLHLLGRQPVAIEL